MPTVTNKSTLVNTWNVNTTPTPTAIDGIKNVRREAVRPHLDGLTGPARLASFFICTQRTANVLVSMAVGKAGWTLMQLGAMSDDIP